MNHLVRKLSRIVGPFNPNKVFFQIAPNQILVKPNSFSEHGNLIDGNALRHLSYGKTSVIPVAMTYGLDQKQQKMVANKLIQDCQNLRDALLVDDQKESEKIGKEMLLDLCTCLQSAKNPSDHTLGQILSNMDVKCATKLEKVIAELKKIPGWMGNVIETISNCCHPLKINQGGLSQRLLAENEKTCLMDARKSFVPFLTDSALEQDHFGMKKMDDSTLVDAEKTFRAKASSIPHSKIHLGGLETLEERSGIQFSGDAPPITNPIKKKMAFEQANNLFEQMETVDSPRVNETFGRVISALGLGRNKMQWNRLIATNSFNPNPFILPVIVDNDLSPDFPTRYSPSKALDVMDDLTTPTDWSMATPPMYGSFNEPDPNLPFPIGSAAPFSPPRRVKKEVV